MQSLFRNLNQSTQLFFILLWLLILPDFLNKLTQFFNLSFREIIQPQNNSLLIPFILDNFNLPFNWTNVLLGLSWSGNSTQSFLKILLGFDHWLLKFLFLNKISDQYFIIRRLLSINNGPNLVKFLTRNRPNNLLFIWLLFSFFTSFAPRNRPFDLILWSVSDFIKIILTWNALQTLFLKNMFDVFLWFFEILQTFFVP